MIDNGYLFAKDNKRIFINTSLGCAGQCAYCYLPKMGYSNSSDNYRTISAQTIIEFIEKNKLDINQKTLITLGCYSECWDEYNKNETISLIKYFLKKGNQIQLSTKKQIMKEELTEILPLINYFGQLVIFVSSATISKHDTIEKDMIEQVIRKVIPEQLIDTDTKFFINPTGRFVIGGPQGDTGLTGRKIVVDTYGGFARHGGGAFSGKDPTKVDRSAAYAARYVAKNLVAAGIAHRCEIQIAYAIGVANPVSVSVNTFGTGVIQEEQILKLIDEFFDLRPLSIINGLGLRKPIYKPTASYGHFGRKDLQLPWEWTDKATVLQSALAKMN